MSSPTSEPFHSPLPSPDSLTTTKTPSKQKPKRRNPPPTTKGKPLRTPKEHIREDFLLHLAGLADSMAARGFYSAISHHSQEISQQKIQREISKEPSVKDQKILSEFSSSDAQMIPYEAAMGSTGDFRWTCNIKDMDDFRQRVMKDGEGVFMRKEVPRGREEFEGINGRRFGNMKDLNVLNKDFAFGEFGFVMEMEAEDIFGDFSSEEEEEDNELDFSQENQANDKEIQEEEGNHEEKYEEIHEENNEENHEENIDYEEEELPEHPDPESLFIEDKVFESEKGEDHDHKSISEEEVMEVVQEESPSISEGYEEEKVIGKSQESPIEIDDEVVVAPQNTQENFNNNEENIQENNEENIQENNNEETLQVNEENIQENNEEILAEEKEIEGNVKEEEISTKNLNENFTEDMRDKSILKGVIMSKILDMIEQVKDRRPRQKGGLITVTKKVKAVKKDGVIKVVATSEEVKKAFERQFKNGEEMMKKSMKQVQEKKQENKATFAKKVFSALTKTSSSINKKRNDAVVDSEGNKAKKKVKREAGWISLEPGLESDFASFMKEKDLDDDSDYETTTGFGGKGGITPRKESEITEEEGRRRSMREKREPRKVYDKALLGVESQEHLERMGYKNLGWYHSHPVFKTTPSQIDQETHLNHQNCYKDHPYLGVIIGPYSTERGFSKTKGEIFVFNVLNNQTYKLNYHIKPSMYLEQRDLLEIVREMVKELGVIFVKEKIIKENMTCRKGVRLNQNWKKGITYRDKILSCLTTLLTENASQFQPQFPPSPPEQESPQETNIEEEKQPQAVPIVEQKAGEIVEMPIETEEVKQEEEMKKGEDEPDVEMEEILALKEKEKIDLSDPKVIKVFVAFLELLLQQEDF